MKFPETPRQEDIQSLKQISYEQINESLLLLENAELKEQWQKFGESWTEFQTSANSSWETLRQMIEAKLNTLETSNAILQGSMDKSLREFTAALTSAADAFSCKMDKVATNLENAADGYISKINEDMSEAHASNERYWRCRHKRNIGVILYLAIAPALTVLNILSRHFGWF